MSESARSLRLALFRIMASPTDRSGSIRIDNIVDLCLKHLSQRHSRVLPQKYFHICSDVEFLDMASLLIRACKKSDFGCNCREHLVSVKGMYNRTG